MKEEIKQRIEQIRHGNVPEGYKKTAAGIIPETWKQVRIGDVCVVNPLRSSFPEEQVTFLGMADVSEEGRLINPSIVDYSTVCKGFTPFERGDILVAKITPCFENGKGADTSALPTQQGYGSTEFHVLRSKDIDKRYLFLHTTSYEFRKKLESEMTGSAGQKRVQTDSVASYLLGLPSAGEQHQIAEIVSAQDRIIELKEKLLSEKQRQKKYLMQQLLAGKKRLPGFDGEWKNVQLNEVLVERKEKNANQDHRICSVAVQKGVVDQIEHLGRSYAAADTSSYGVAHYGDIIYTKSPTGDFPYGIIKQSQMNEEVAVSPLYGIYEPVCYEMGYLLHTYFSYATNCSNYLLPIIQKGAKNTINITNDVFVSNKLFLPMEQGEQKALAKIFITADNEIDLLRQSIEQEKQKKKALMQLLLTGIVRM